MTDAQLSALCGVLEVAARLNKPVEPYVMKQALDAADAYLRARKYFRMTRGQHEDRCNSIMGWNDTTCDCPYIAFKKALLDEGADGGEHPMTGAL